MNFPDSALFKDLLDRFVLIEKQISYTDSEGKTVYIENASPRYFDNPKGGPFPKVHNWINNIQLTRPKGQQVTRITLQITSRFIGGPASAGYQGEMEDRLNYAYLSFIQALDNRPHLNDPTGNSNTPFPYLAPNEGAALLNSPNGTTAFVYDDPNAPMFGGEFITQVVLEIPRSRKS